MKTIVIALLLCHSFVFAQVIPFNSDQWKFKNPEYSLLNHMGKDAVLLKKNSAMFQNANFENGIIEYDMAFPEGRAFIGLQFRIQDEKNYEEFYIRPHQSGNPDANQYTPVFGGNAAWQLYYGEGYGAPIKYDFNTWTHFKLVISGQYMEVYINDMEKPALFAQLKRTPIKGNIGIANPINESYFANVSIQRDDNVVLKGKPKPAEKMAPGTVEKWSVSQTFNLEQLATVSDLKNFKFEPQYATHRVEPTGTLNLSSVAEVNEKGNTVFARIQVESDAQQVKKLIFGFSDRVIVFVNGVPIFQGEDNFVSRDYRFLGTIGYFDAVFLPLRKGKNEIIFAVSESFGGWGIKAKFDDEKSIKLLYQ